MKQTNGKKIGHEAGRIGVYFANHGYFSSETFATLREAIVYARSKGFTAYFYFEGTKLLGEWDAIGGIRLTNDGRKVEEMEFRTVAL